MLHRRYSIVKKRCKFEGCANYPKMGCGGYCEDHKEHDPGFKRKEDRKIAKKEEAKVRIDASKKDNKLFDNAGAAAFQDLQNFFYEAQRQIDRKPQCLECNTFIPSSYYRAAVAHLLPKKEDGGFPSVATHPLNWLPLGAGCGCHDKTHRWDKFVQMKIWPIALQRIITMYPSIAKNELKNLPDFLWEEIEKVYGPRPPAE